MEHEDGIDAICKHFERSSGTPLAASTTSCWLGINEDIDQHILLHDCPPLNDSEGAAVSSGCRGTGIVLRGRGTTYCVPDVGRLDLWLIREKLAIGEARWWDRPAPRRIERCAPGRVIGRLVAEDGERE